MQPEEKLDEETGNIVAHREENLYCDYMKERRNGNCNEYGIS